MSKKRVDSKEEEQLHVKNDVAEDSAAQSEHCAEDDGDAKSSVNENGSTPVEGTSGEKTEEENAQIAKEALKKANDRYLRLMAEFDNYKKRTAREHQQMVELANEKVMRELIHVRNTFELAIKHGETSTDYQKFYDGIKLIFNKFDGVLSAHGLSSFAEKGEPFDPLIHEALMKTPHEEIPDEHIADIYEKGYRLHDRIIKHAKVIVSSGKPVAAESSVENGVS